MSHQTNIQRAQIIVNAWPDWKRKITLTKHSSRTINEKRPKMLSDDQINEISIKYCFEDVEETTAENIYIMSRAIKEALELNEKIRWKYPENGELPEDKETVMVCFGERKYPDMAIHDKQCESFIDIVHHLHFSYHEVKAWTYVPTLDGE